MTSRIGSGVAVTLLLGALLGALVGCGGSGTPKAVPSPATSAVPTTSAPTASPTPTGSPSSSSTRSSAPPPRPRPASRITKLMVLVVENHSLDSMRAEMPSTFALARSSGYAVGYRAITHPSLPNYLAISGGDTFGVTDDRSPAAHVLHGPSVFGQALALHRTAKAYVEGMDENCAREDRGRYAVRHNPWAYYVDERAACARYDVPLDELTADIRAGRLPNAGMATPDLCDDAHDCPLANADRWLRTVLGQLMRGPDYARGRLLIVVTADEDDHDQGNLVLTTLVSPQLHHVVVSRPLSHYSLARLYSEVVGAEPLRQARSAPSMVRAFGLVAGPRTVS